MNNILLEILLIGGPILFAITIHEFAHGYMADRLGDPTPRLAGRLTLNPLSHLDLIGTLMFFIAKIGWAKPVPVDPYNFQNPRKGMLLVALAGPAVNLIAAFIFGMFLRGILFFGLPPVFPQEILFYLIYIIQILVFFNIILAIFNVIPIFPLDGYRILAGLLPLQQAYELSQFAKYGPFILLGIILIDYFTEFRIIWMIIGAPVEILNFLFTGQNLPF